MVLKEQGATIKLQTCHERFNTWKDKSAMLELQCHSIRLWILAGTRVALGKSRTIACLDVSMSFLHAGLKDEVHLTLDLEALTWLNGERIESSIGDSGRYHRVA